jgi:hypothetical protein
MLLISYWARRRIRSVQIIFCAWIPVILFIIHILTVDRLGHVDCITQRQQLIFQKPAHQVEIFAVISFPDF